MPKSQRRSKHPEEMVTIGFCYLCLKCLRFSFLHRKRKFLFCCFRFKLRRIHTQPPKYFSVSGHIFRLSFCFVFCSNERPTICSQFRWSCLHVPDCRWASRILSRLCNGRSLFHKWPVLGFLLLETCSQATEDGQAGRTKRPIFCTLPRLHYH